MSDVYNQLISYANALVRRRWQALIVACLVASVGWTIVALLPNTYTSTGQIYVDTRTVLRPLLKGLAVEADADAELAVMQQTLLSRPNLEEVARRTDLDLLAETPADMERLVANLHDHIQVTASHGNLFSITVEDTRAKRAADLAQALINIFVESNLGASRNDMASAHRFLDQQIHEYQQQLEAAEARLAAFKQENLALLPGPGGFQNRLETAKTNLATAQLELRDAMTEHQILERELAATPRVVASDAPAPRGQAPAASSTAQRIAELERLQDQLLIQFTDKHPDVVNVQRQLADLRAQAATEGPGRRNSYGGPVVPNQAYTEIRLRMIEKEADIAKLRERVAQNEAIVADLSSRAFAVPQVEAQLVKLNRDYAVLKGQYEELLARREQAKISREREESGEKVQFRIVDPPRVPETPSGPNRPLLLLAVLPLALAAGIGVAILRSLISDTFSEPRQLGDAFGLPVVGAVSLLSQKGAAAQRGLEAAAYITVFVGLLSAFGFLQMMESRVGLGKVTAAVISTGSPAPMLAAVRDTVSAMTTTVFPGS